MHPIRLVAPVAALVLGLSALAGPPGAIAQSPSDPPPSISADWPMFRGDAARRGESAEGVVGTPVLVWRYQAQGAVNASMAVAGDLAYASSDDGILHALDLGSGTERWTFSPTHTPVSAPAVADGVVYVFDALGTLFALDAATGQERWHAAEPLDGPSGPTVADGSLYVGTAGGDLVAVDTASGAERWRYAVSPGTGVHSPAYSDGLVYVASNAGGYVAVDASSGQLVWHADTGTDVTGTAVVADGIAWIGGTDDAIGHLRALDARTGAPLWQTAGPMWAPAVSEGVAYAGSHGGLVAAYEAATGRELWHFQVEGIARGTAVAQGVVYVPADDEHRVYALDGATGTELWRFNVDGNNDGGIAVARGSVFVGTVLGGVYDIGGDGSAVAPMPGTSTAPVATPAPAASAGPAPSTVAQLPEGRYATAPLTQDQIRAAVIAAGYDPGPVRSTPSTVVFTLQFESGRLTIFGSDDGGPISQMWSGTYQVVDDHTLIARDAISAITYDYALVGDVLTMRMVSDTLQDPGELAAQSGVYDTAPFTRVH